jgi:Spy/CpxP family protein refolding chaperone
MRSFALRALSLGTALTLGAAVLSAQAPAQARRGAQDRQQQSQARADRMDRAGGARAVFRGITLTEAQRTRVREVQQRYAQQRRELAGQARAARPDSALRADRQRPDSAARAALRTQREAMRSRMQQLTDRQFADLRTVLEPSQQATFDRNVSELKQRVAQRGQGRGDRAMRRGPGARGDAVKARPGASRKRGA